MSFSSLGLDPRILKAIAVAGYTEPTPIQAAAIPPVLEGNDLIGIAQTGTGKTAAFTLPILSRLVAHLPHGHGTRAPSGASTGGQAGAGEAALPESIVPAAPAPPAPSQTRPASRPGSHTKLLVLAPTRELVVQIAENVDAYAKFLPLRSTLVYGGVSERPQIQALRTSPEVVIATPGRLLDLFGRRYADFSQLEVLVLDEADRMLDMGFLPDIRRIIRSLPVKRQSLLFSATLSPEIERIAREFLQNPKIIQVGRRATPAESVAQFIYEVQPFAKHSLLLHLLEDPAMNMVLVFVRTKFGADKVARRLQDSKIPTATLHSNRSQGQRLRALKDFKSGKVRVLVATDIAARGIDVDGISHVVNFDFPPHPEDYVHRIGRTGRAHAVGDAISFVTPLELNELRALERFIGRGIVRRRVDGFSPAVPYPAHGTLASPPPGVRAPQPKSSQALGLGAGRRFVPRRRRR